MDVDKDKRNVLSDSEGLRSKRKFGKKGSAAPKMQINTLRDESEGKGTPSVYDLALDKENIDQILSVTKTRPKSMKSKGLRVRKGEVKQSSKESKVTKTDKARKKRKSLTMNKGPDSESEEDLDDDDNSEAPKKRRARR